MSTAKDTRRIIITADDFGLTEGINKGIIDAFRYGIITRTSLLPCAMAFDHAVALAKQNPGLNIGVHLTLVGETPVSSPDKIRSLVDSNNIFYKDHQVFLLKYFLKKIKLEEVYYEFEAQIKKILDVGIIITHIDSHQHLHVLPGVFQETIALAKKFKIRNIRIIKQDYLNIRSLKELALVILSGSAIKKCKKMKLNTDIAFADEFWGLNRSGLIREDDLLNLFDRINSGVTEVMCHPGYGDEKYSKRYSHWGYNPDRELKALVSQNVKNKLKSQKIETIS